MAKRTCGHIARPRGWEAYAERLEYHPITGQPLKNPGWWIKETYTGE